jgi:hypothetical protein
MGAIKENVACGIDALGDRRLAAEFNISNPGVANDVRDIL